MTSSEFDALVEAALSEIPREFLDLLANLEISVRERPGREAGRWKGSPTLLGLYIGPTREELVAGQAAEPGRIVLYRRNIAAGCPTPEALKRQIRLTLRHELAHHFGFSDRDLRERWPEGA